MSEKISNSDHCSHIDLEFIKPGNVITVSGSICTGKTTFVKNTIKCLIDKRNSERIDYSSFLRYFTNFSPICIDMISFFAIEYGDIIVVNTPNGSDNYQNLSIGNNKVIAIDSISELNVQNSSKIIIIDEFFHDIRYVLHNARRTNNCVIIVAQNIQGLNYAAYNYRTNRDYTIKLLEK